MSDSSPIKTIIVLESIGTKTKKRGNCTCLLVPRREALASPGSSETSNAEAHADMIYTTPTWQPCAQCRPSRMRYG